MDYQRTDDRLEGSRFDYIEKLKEDINLLVLVASIGWALAITGWSLLFVEWLLKR